MSLCYIQLLGDFQLRYGDQVVTTINQPRLQSLLAYLLLHRHAPQARHHLAFTFWPDVQEAQARNNLRQIEVTPMSRPRSDENRMDLID